MSFAGIAVVPPGDFHLYDATYSTLSPSSTRLAFVDAMETPMGWPFPIAAQTGRGWLRFLPGFIRGDCDRSGVVDLGDVIFMPYVITPSPPHSECVDACDVNDDGEFDLADLFYALEHLFLTGPPPPAPYPTCGFDVTDPGIECDVTPCP